MRVLKCDICKGENEVSPQTIEVVSLKSEDYIGGLSTIEIKYIYQRAQKEIDICRVCLDTIHAPHHFVLGSTKNGYMILTYSDMFGKENLNKIASDKK